MASVQLRFDNLLPSAVTLTLTAQEAQLIRDLLSAVGHTGDVRNLTGGIARTLQDAGFTPTGDSRQSNFEGVIKSNPKVKMNYKGNEL